MLRCSIHVHGVLWIGQGSGMTTIRSVEAPLTKVLVIGIDSGSPHLIDKWIAAGDLPTFARLKEESLHGLTATPEGVGNGSVWTSFHLGLNPGNHPFFDGLRHYSPETYTDVYYTAEEMAVPQLWRRLDDAGQRCLIVDAPYAHLETLTNGVMIMDWGQHAALNGSTLKLVTSPPELADEVRALVGEDPLQSVKCDSKPRESLAEYREFFRQLKERAEKRVTLTRHYLEKGGWDYTQTVFAELHCAGHHFWHINQPDHPQYEARLERALGEPLRDIYRVVDQGVGDILTAVDERTHVIVYCSHGIGPHYAASGLLDRILKQIDTGARAELPKATLKDKARQAWLSLPGEIRSGLRPLAEEFGKRANLHPPRYMSDRAMRRFFEVPVSNRTGGVRINLKGREANGIVDPADYDNLLEEIAAALREVVKVETGEPLVTGIRRPNELFDGPFLGDFPDLLIAYNRDNPIETVQSDRIGMLRQAYGGLRSGDHEPEGAFFATGPGIAPSALNAQTDPVDFAPTIARLLGVDIGSFDGKVIPGFERA